MYPSTLARYNLLLKDYITAVIVRQILFKVSPNIKNGEDVPHHFVFIAISYVFIPLSEAI